MAKKKPSSGKPQKHCRKCTNTKGLRWVEDDQAWYCVAHFPGGEVAFKATAKAAGEASGKARREKALAKRLNIKIEGNKASALQALVDQVNFFGEDLTRKDTKRARLVLDMVKQIHDWSEKETGEQQEKAKVEEIMGSALPKEIKLSKLVDIVGPMKAMEICPVEMERDDYAAQTLDGAKILQNAEKTGETITKPETLQVQELEETADVPELQVPGPDDPGLPQPAGPTPDAPPEEEAPATQQKDPPEEQTARCFRQAKELLGLYRTKVSGRFKPDELVGKMFYEALVDGIPFKDLQQRVLFPKSDTDQPEAMINDVEREWKERQKRESA